MSRTEDLGRLREEIQAGHRDRMEFVVNLRQTVAGLRKRFMDENRAAHAARLGPTRAQVTEPTERYEVVPQFLVRGTARVEPGAGEKADMPGLEAAQRDWDEVKATAMKERGKSSRKGREEKPSRKGRGR